MEEFYELLKNYNTNLVSDNIMLEPWFYQYTESTPPLYWSLLYEILSNVDRRLPVIEVGAGYGDVTSLLCFLGFESIIGFERDNSKVEIASKKIYNLFQRRCIIKNTNYPVQLDYKPGILIQVNCVYVDNCLSKKMYLESITNNYIINGGPDIFVFEAIDDSFMNDSIVFPEFVRLNRKDIEQLFPSCSIRSYSTYKYPENSISKTMYVICKS